MSEMFSFILGAVLVFWLAVWYLKDEDDDDDGL